MQTKYSESQSLKHSVAKMADDLQTNRLYILQMNQKAITYWFTTLFPDYFIWFFAFEKSAETSMSLKQNDLMFCLTHLDEFKIRQDVFLHRYSLFIVFLILHNRWFFQSQLFSILNQDLHLGIRQLEYTDSFEAYFFITSLIIYQSIRNNRWKQMWMHPRSFVAMLLRMTYITKK